MRIQAAASIRLLASSRKKLYGLCAGHGGEILQKNVERIAGFKVINQRAHRNARAGEARRATHDFRVNHHHGFCIHNGKITQPTPDRQVVKRREGVYDTISKFLKEG